MIFHAIPKMDSSRKLKRMIAWKSKVIYIKKWNWCGEMCQFIKQLIQWEVDSICSKFDKLILQLNLDKVLQ